MVGHLSNLTGCRPAGVLAQHAFQYMRTRKEVVISAADFDGRDFETVSCVRGYHIYKIIWSPTAGCEREEAIPEDPHIIVRQRDQGIYGLFRNLRALGCSVPSAARALLRVRRFLNRP